MRDDGSQAGVEEEVGSGIGVRDDGSQAGVEELDTPGIGGGPRRADFI